jgi:transposase
MVTIGVDTHKRSHTAVAVDEQGVKRAEKTVPATPEGHLELMRWASRFSERGWAIEDCRHLCRRLSADLLRAGETVDPVPPTLMAGARRAGREPGKSDPIDALAVARAAQREPDLPRARLDGPEREVRLLVDHREDLVTERTRVVNRLRSHLHELEPGFEPKAGGLERAVSLRAIEQRLAAHQGVVAWIALQQVAQVRELTRSIDALAREIASRVSALAPALMATQGCGPLTAAKLVGETAGIERFHSAAAYARHNGTAPVPVWSGNTECFRLSRGGNRQINTALHRIAITQIRLGGRGRVYFDHRREQGDTKTEAIRALRRKISDEVYRRLRDDANASGTSTTELVAAA